MAQSGVSRLVFPGRRPRFFLFSPFSARDCVKVSGGFLYKLPSNMGRSQRFPFQGGSAPFCGAGFVKQNLGWELAPPASTLASPLSAPLPPSTYQLRRKSFAQLLRENHLQAKSLPFSTPGESVVNPQPFLSQPVKPSSQKGLGHLTAQTSPLFPQMGNRPH